MSRILAAHPLISVALALAGVSCAATFRSGEGGGGGSGTALTCVTDAACDDQNPCTTDTCGDDGCAHTKLDGVPAAEQTAGDCNTVMCVDGVATDQPDDSDIPAAHQECWTDTCFLHVAEPVGTKCTATANEPGICDGQGNCVAGDCFSDASCAPAGPCDVVSCDLANAKCVHTPMPDGTPTPGVTQTPADCHAHVCVGGTDTNVTDDSDVADDGNPCTVDVCMAGVSLHPFVPAGTPCGANLVCDGAGQCM